jgi:hypothetical protein
MNKPAKDQSAAVVKMPLHNTTGMFAKPPATIFGGQTEGFGTNQFANIGQQQQQQLQQQQQPVQDLFNQQAPTNCVFGGKTAFGQQGSPFGNTTSNTGFGINGSTFSSIGTNQPTGFGHGMLGGGSTFQTVPSVNGLGGTGNPKFIAITVSFYSCFLIYELFDHIFTD